MTLPVPPDPMLVSTTLRTRLPFTCDLINMDALAGDASNRRYFRLQVKNERVPSLILMQLADPEGFKASEEAMSGSGTEVTELPFLNILRPMARVGLAVPEVYYYDEVAGLLYLEDFGDVTLFQACHEGGEEAIHALYPKAIDALARLHLRLQPEMGEGCVAFSRSFDANLFMWEFDHFFEYGIGARRGKKPLCADHERVIRDMFTRMAEFIAAQPKVFTHRDYHSRNLMVAGDRLGVIDFQDALLGPVTYDLASLLRDSYIALDEEFVDAMIERYREAMCTELDHARQDQMLLSNPPAFRRLFDFTSIQRNLKAAGRFVYIDQVKGNPKFLADIPRTLEYVRQNVRKYSELEPLQTALTPYIPEWQ